MLNVFLGFNDITGLLTLGICGSGLIFSFLNFIILFKFRDTPFVKAFDLPKLVKHLLFMTFSFGFYPYLFFGEPSPLKCFLQPVSIPYVLSTKRYQSQKFCSCCRTISFPFTFHFDLLWK